MGDFLMSHGRGWKYIRAVPRELRAVVGKKYWTRYIGAAPKSTAKAKALDYAAADQKVIDGLLALTDEERTRIANTAVFVGGSALGEAKPKEIRGLDAWVLVEKGGPMSLRFLEFAVAPSRTEGDPLVDHAQQAEQEGIDVGQALLDAALARQSFAKAQADVAADRAIKLKMSHSTYEPVLMTLVRLWIRVKVPRNPKTVEKTTLYVHRFAQLAGDLQPSQVTREHVIRFRDALEERGMSASNITQHLDKLHTLFNVALSEGIVASNPAHKVKARRVNGKLSGGRQGFDAARVRSIFKALKGESADFSWTMKLLAYHGMRGGEACQLKVDDVVELHGVIVLRVHDRHGQVKNKHSVRDIPLHPACKGIVAYAKKVAKVHGVDAWLFQSWQAQKQGRAHGFQNYGNREFLRKKVGIRERCHTLHSFRHTFRTLCREVEMPESVSASLMGHSLGKGEHAAYGSGPSLKKRAEWIAKVDPLKG